MPKNKPRKGLLKRVRFTKSGRMKYRRASGRHLRSHKSGKLMRSYRRPAYAARNDVRKLMAMTQMRIKTSDKGDEKATDERSSE